MTTTEEKFKQGDIIRNRWAGEENPTRFFVIWKIYGKRASVIELINGRLYFEWYSYNNVYELFHDGQPAFVKVGQTRAFELMKQDLEDVFKEEN